MTGPSGTAIEVNFDGLVGPTHNYAGLSWGNIASESNKGGVSHPKRAVIQGLAKMRALMELGLTQGFLPPHERPHLPTLRALGFTGPDRAVYERAAKEAPALLYNTLSASPMWTANAATVSPGADTKDHRVHFSPANLISMFHRSIEAEMTAKQLELIFADPAHFAHHPALPGAPAFGDEGAANHGRMGARHGDSALELFVYGKTASQEETKRFPARQTRLASEAIARRHKLSAEQVVFARQAPEAIDAGAFHNDVVSVTNGPALFYHEQAFADKTTLLDEIRHKAQGFEPIFIEVPADAVTLEEAVATYLFNSQLITLPSGGMLLVLPGEVQENDRVRGYAESLVAGNGPIEKLAFFDLRESMRNGGGPACLRLRVVLTPEERAATHQSFILTPERLDQLEAWADRTYSDELRMEDLRDPELMTQSFRALDELTGLLGIGAFYSFQK